MLPNPTTKTGTKDTVYNPNWIVSKGMIEFFKKAKQVIFELVDKQSFITFFNPDGLVNEQRYRWQCNSSVAWGDMNYHPTYGKVEYRVNSVELQTIWKSLRAGDIIKLDWYADFLTTEHLESCNMHKDVLYVEVVRGKNTFTYLVAVEVAMGSSFRMLQVR